MTRKKRVCAESIQRKKDGYLLEFDASTSERMARVRRKNTSPELAVRKLLSEIGLRYRIENHGLPGSPDIANRKRKWAIFVYGCFWHRHMGCPRATTPSRNREFWEQKFSKNVERDKAAIDSLERMGFAVLVVWECDIQNAEHSDPRRQLLAKLNRLGKKDG